MALATAGYSGTPLPKKLGLKDGQRAAFVNLPEVLSELATSREFAEVVSSLEAAADLEFVQLFTTERAELAEALKAARQRIRPDGVIWAIWPKKASRAPTDITEDVVREEAFRLDLVDVKVCAVDAVWSGLKLVIRKEKR